MHLKKLHRIFKFLHFKTDQNLEYLRNGLNLP